MLQTSYTAIKKVNNIRLNKNKCTCIQNTQMKMISKSVRNFNINIAVKRTRIILLVLHTNSGVTMCKNRTRASCCFVLAQVYGEAIRNRRGADHVLEVGGVT